MSTISQTILVLLAGAALLVYTISNYLAGRSDASYLIVTIGLVGWFSISMVAKLVRELRDK